jgi:hypothetical protein
VRGARTAPRDGAIETGGNWQLSGKHLTLLRFQIWHSSCEKICAATSEAITWSDTNEKMDCSRSGD